MRRDFQGASVRNAFWMRWVWTELFARFVKRRNTLFLLNTALFVLSRDAYRYPSVIGLVQSRYGCCPSESVQMSAKLNLGPHLHCKKCFAAPIACTSSILCPLLVHELGLAKTCAFIQMKCALGCARCTEFKAHADYASG